MGVFARGLRTRRIRQQPAGTEADQRTYRRYPHLEQGFFWLNGFWMVARPGNNNKRLLHVQEALWCGAGRVEQVRPAGTSEEWLIVEHTKELGSLIDLALFFDLALGGVRPA